MILLKLNGHKWLNTFEIAFIIGKEMDYIFHPLDEFADVIKEMVTVYSYDFGISEDGSSNENRLSDGSFVRIAGIVTDIKSISTKNNRMMAL